VNQPFLKNHLIDFEIVAALVVPTIAHFYFALGWPMSFLLGLSAFVLIPLLFLCWSQARAIFFTGGDQRTR
jgi:uncharacterized membrane protein YhhN